MQCWECEQPTQGICRFCGRMAWKDHAVRMPFILAIHVVEHRMPKAVVAHPIYCGTCKPQAEPIEMPGNLPGERMLPKRKGASHARYV